MTSHGNRDVLQFAPADVARFARASRDANPIHVSESVARLSPFGSPIVHGALGTLAALGLLRPRPGQRIGSLTVDFPGPIYVGVPYEAEIEDSPENQARVRLRDGRRLAVRLTARFVPRGAEARHRSDELVAMPTEPADRSLDDLSSGSLRIEGRWSPGPQDLGEIVRIYGLEERGIDETSAAAIALCSYLVGMQVPGKRSLFSSMKLDVQGLAGWPIDYALEVASFDERFGLLSASAALRSPVAGTGKVAFDAYLREDVPLTSVEGLATALSSSRIRQGRVALVTGASRGLGASLSLGLVLCGYTVIGSCRQLTPETDRLERLASIGPGTLKFVAGDAADSTWASEARALVSELGGIDLLVCNACPPLRPLWLEQAATSRLDDHVARAVAMVSTPLAYFLPVLAEKSGLALVVSSAAVDEPVAEWPHYVAGKYAVEGLARVAAVEYPGTKLVVVRPPRLLTDLTNTPLGRDTSLGADAAAAIVVRALVDDENIADGFGVLDLFGQKAK